jgi:hypothetical protein
MPQMFAAIPAWWGALSAGTQTAIGATAATAVGAGTSALLAPHGGIHIPPPPGAAMVDQAGAMAAGDLRQRQAAAAGLQSTVGAGGAPGAATGYANVATGGQKVLLGA